MSQSGFIFGGNTGRSYQDIKRMRERAAALQPSSQVVSGIAGFGDGLATLGQALARKRLTEKANRLEQEGRSDFANQLHEFTQSQQGDKQGQLLKMMGNPYSSVPQQNAMQLLLQRELEGNKTPERKVVTDAMGRKRYPDDQSYVFDNMRTYDKNVLSDAALAQKQAIAEAGRSITNVNNNIPSSLPKYGALDKGYVYKRDQNGDILINENGSPTVMPITGSKAEQDIQKTVEAKENKQKMKETYSNIVIDDIDRAAGLITSGGARLPVTGFGADLSSMIAGTDSHQVAKLIETVKSNAGFDKLQQMRDASPTGGALGSVSEREIKFLQAAIGNLDQSQSEEELLYNLNRVRDIYISIVHGPKKHQEETEVQPVAEDTEIEDLLKKYGGAP